MTLKLYVLCTDGYEFQGYLPTDKHSIFAHFNDFYYETRNYSNGVRRVTVSAQSQPS